MLKTLDSGVKIDANVFYKLLDWKDKYPDKFDNFIRIYGQTPHLNTMDKSTWSINRFNKHDIDALILYVGDYL